MHKSIKILGCFAILAAPFFAATPAHAVTHTDWSSQHADMDSVRSDREELQGERDRLKEQCMDAKGQGRSACEEKMADLRKREEALHEKMETVHENRETAHEIHHQKKMEAHKAVVNKTPAKKAAKKHKKPATTAPSDQNQ
jgi:chromosome segregation ATPase